MREVRERVVVMVMVTMVVMLMVMVVVVVVVMVLIMVMLMLMVTLGRKEFGHHPQIQEALSPGLTAPWLQHRGADCARGT